MPPNYTCGHVWVIELGRFAINGQSRFYLSGAKPKLKEWKKLRYTGPGAFIIEHRQGFAKFIELFSPRDYIPFDTFADSGFAYWSEERLMGYGFSHSWYKAKKPPFLLKSRAYSFAWYSVLSSEDQIAVKERAVERLKKCDGNLNV